MSAFLFYAILLYVIIRLFTGKRKGAKVEKGAAQRRSSPISPITVTGASSRAAAKKRAMQNTQNSPDTLSTESAQACLGEGESLDEHNAHLLESHDEGESAEEHSGHMIAADTAAESIHNETSRNTHASPIRLNRQSLRRDILMREILDKPVSMRRRKY